MIQQLNPMTLQYVNDNGDLATVTMNDWALFTKINAVFSQQKAAAIDNNHNKDIYMQTIGQINDSVLNGRSSSLAIPAKPKYQAVSDTGVVTWVDFSPPLPDPGKAKPNNSASIVTQGVPFTPDPVQQAMLSGLVSVHQTIDDLVSALKAKGVI